ncbi:MAG: type I-U CRISPR-associated helicase/endonuclease Cas3 [Verrucomicrobiota bacterium]
MNDPNFATLFAALWKTPKWEKPTPFPWQSMLAEGALNGEWPEAINLPTASGKTACLDAAVFALAHCDPAASVERRMPRRIWFVVDRRIVVDEAFDRAWQLADKLQNAKAGPIKEIADRLRALSGTERPLAVARLRGGTWRDDSWARLPTQPAIICSTVDQVGSALLFRSYGHSDRTASIWAGLAANDSLILLDEAHCAVPFLQTLRAIAGFRGERWVSAPIKTPFRFSILSATPPADIPEEASFPRPAERIAALNDPVLQLRLAARKLATLLPVKGKGDTDELIAAASKQASNFLGNGRQRVAVMVNRVATAEAIAVRVRKDVGDRAEVILLTGRMRPLDRDALVAKWSPLLKAGSGEQPAKPIIVVTTQCLEVGADFSFDALVTECASLDALRQRFGRLDRLGEMKEPLATILIREAEADAKGQEPDPIYGEALAKTWHWLSDKATPGLEKDAKEINFGVNALDALVNPLRASDEGRFRALLAPTADAPILLPAHLDLLCQTAPRPVPEPEVSLFLHGKERGAPEVRVLWRADLSEVAATEPTREDEDTWLETLSLLPPTSPEMLSVPLYRLRHWLAEGRAEKADDADVEGLPEERAPERGKKPRHHARSVFCLWRGRERSAERRSLLTSDVRAIRPGDVVVLPAEIGIVGLGQATPDNPGLGPERLDLAERALRQARGRVVIRLNRKLLGEFAKQPDLAALLAITASSEPERSEIKEALLNLVAASAAPEGAASPPLSPLHWLVEHARLLAKDDFQLEEHPAGGLILTGKKLRPLRDGETEDDPLADDEDTTSSSNESVTLRHHTATVQALARDFAVRCLGPDFAELYGEAGYSHDFGKLDPRFQFYLNNGDELTAGEEPLAKSARLPERRRRRRDLREDSQLPEGFRHEFLSAQLAEHAGLGPAEPHARDLFLHLLGSHHGHARPFAPIALDPVVADGKATDLTLTSLQCGATLTGAERGALPAPHELRAGVADRFWRLNRRHGWWGLAYLEAIFRLADWHASGHPDIVVGSGLSKLSVPSLPAASAVVCTLPSQLPLDALDGANPLAFLATLGTLRTLTKAWPEGRVRLGWRIGGGCWQPVIQADGLPEDADRARIHVRDAVARSLNIGFKASAQAASAREDSQRAFEAARGVWRKKLKDFKDRNLKGREGRTVKDRETAPLRDEMSARRDVWLEKLRAAVPSLEMALGKRLNVPSAKFRECCEIALHSTDRWVLDQLAHFGSDACLQPRKQELEPPLFSFVNGSGQQFFLDTARQLVSCVTADQLFAALFRPWQPNDDKLSMRWNPSEDRRYALMAEDPTAGGNEPKTIWAANLLGYVGLGLLPSAPTSHGLGTVSVGSAGDNPAFIWPVWRGFLSAGAVSSLLARGELQMQPSQHQELHALGVSLVFRSERIEVGSGTNIKLNFTPGKAI